MTAVLNTLISFDGTNGSNPAGGLLDANGDLFGTTSGGVSGDGTVFELVPNNDGTGTYTLNTLVTFNGTAVCHCLCARLFGPRLGFRR